QAEDGIRDFHVTGVQTCALPISGRSRCFAPACTDKRPATSLMGVSSGNVPAASRRVSKASAVKPASRQRSVSSREPAKWKYPNRSEERRVGKEGRSLWSPSHWRE